MLAGLILLVMVIDTMATVYCVVRMRGIVEHVNTMSKVVGGMGDVMRNICKQQDRIMVEPKQDETPTLDLSAAMELASQATPEQVAQAEELLKKLGLGE